MPRMNSLQSSMWPGSLYTDYADTDDDEDMDDENEFECTMCQLHMPFLPTSI